MRVVGGGAGPRDPGHPRPEAPDGQPSVEKWSPGLELSTATEGTVSDPEGEDWSVPRRGFLNLGSEESRGSSGGDGWEK